MITHLEREKLLEVIEILALTLKAKARAAKAEARAAKQQARAAAARPKTPRSGFKTNSREGECGPGASR
jgi:hypothetical protein